MGRSGGKIEITVAPFVGRKGKWESNGTSHKGAKEEGKNGRYVWHREEKGDGVVMALFMGGGGGKATSSAATKRIKSV